MIYVFQARSKLHQEDIEKIKNTIKNDLKQGVVLLESNVAFVAALSDSGKTEVVISED